MSRPIESNATPVGEFVAQFGAPPGTQDAPLECEQWQQLCAKLLAERAQLQARLARAHVEMEAELKSLAAMMCEDEKVELTMAEVYAQVDKATSLDQLISEVEQEAELKS